MNTKSPLLIFCLFIFWLPGYSQTETGNYETIKIFDLEKNSYVVCEPFYKSIIGIRFRADNIIVALTYDNELVILTHEFKIARRLDVKQVSSANKNRFRKAEISDNGEFIRLTFIDKAFQEKYACFGINDTLTVLPDSFDPKKLFTLKESTAQDGKIVRQTNYGLIEYNQKEKELSVEREKKDKIIKTINCPGFRNPFIYQFNRLSFICGDKDITIVNLENNSIQNIRKLETINYSQISDYSCSSDGKFIVYGVSFPERKKNLYLLSIGINNYKFMMNRNLKLAVPDAIAFSNNFYNSVIGLYEDIEPKILLDSAATYRNIISEIDKIRKKSNNDDDFMFFYSGQSDLIKKDSASRSIYGLTPYDCDFKSDLNFLTDTLFSGIIKRLPLTALLIIDSNGSYDLIKPFIESKENTLSKNALRGNMLEKIVYKKEISFIGYPSNEPAWEIPQLSHGLLTFALLNGISGKADFGCPGDKIITNSELFTYIQYEMYGLDNRLTNIKSYLTNKNIVSFSRSNIFGNMDIIPPKIDIIEPLKKDSVTFEKYTKIKIRVTDNSDLFQVSINNRPTDSKEGDIYTSDILLKNEGENTVSLIAQDINGNTTKDTISIFFRSRERRDYAIFFCTDQYDDPYWRPLNNPVKDARTIAGILQSEYGFRTKIVENPTHDSIHQVLRESISNNIYGSHDQLFIFFSGHGFFDPLTIMGGIVARDTKRTGTNNYSYSDLATLLDRHKCEHIFLVIDVCYSGTLFPTIAMRGKDITRGNTPESGEEIKNDYLNSLFMTKTRLALTSSGKEQVSDGIEHSPFAKGIIDVLKQNQKKFLFAADIETTVREIPPYPKFGYFGNNETGSGFVFIKK